MLDTGLMLNKKKKKKKKKKEKEKLKPHKVTGKSRLSILKINLKIVG